MRREGKLLREIGDELGVGVDRARCIVAAGEREEGKSSMWNHTNVLDKKVTVCGACETAACWHGSFMCDYAEMAGTKELTVRELWSRPRGENAEYWFKDANTGEIDRDQLASFQTATR